ncbi:PilW family protein [Aquabacterium sp. OR-4]|uniref:PilW family protein n=1 Tax=Aquabacterium sp. OR-4 TaxID=2978127 RepID=UPI0021B19622|nr:prepilin-type N-terminal cleavage/methylation domain-containing protein [Aquabacterium sp. OR-4]MDT7836351.1 prepilin-type N-terminal cleavage/methylation domain-containing protein [Aquabacterium sp. OR-4]
MNANLSRPAKRQRGVSLVELMVGVTIGLFILAAATLVVTSQLGDNRRMLLDAQLQQDMRATVDIAMRDIRRAGYWGRAWGSVWSDSVAEALGNPYSTVSASRSESAGDSIEYDRSTDEDVAAQRGTDNNTVDSNERVGFRHNPTAGTVEMRIGEDNWQTLTDATVMKVTQFDIVYTSRAVPLPCGTQCQRGPVRNCPMDLMVRDASVVISAEARHDSSVKRSARSDVRLRNDLLVERSAC